MSELNGKIGVFDSGLGGLTILKEIINLIPNREYLYLGDNLRAPYGNKSQDEIFEHTLAGVEWLLSRGAEIVVLACNTASSNALRRIQQEALPFKYPDKRVLGIIIPTVESMENISESGHFGILATTATVASGIFEKEAIKYNPKIQVSCQSGGELARMIEQDKNQDLIASEIKNVTDKLIERDELIDTVILGCTHYALIKQQIKEILSKDMKVIGQGDMVAVKLADYLNRHEEIRRKLSDKFSVNFYTTSGSEDVRSLMSRFFGSDIDVSIADYEIKK